MSTGVVSSEMMRKIDEVLEFGKKTPQQIRDDVEKALLPFDQQISNLILPEIQVFDGSVFAKSSFADKDDLDPTATEWKAVPMGAGDEHFLRSYPGKKTVVFCTNCLVMSPGHYNNPRYSLDWSASKVEFVIANAYATSRQINNAISDREITIKAHGEWNDNSLSVLVDALDNIGSLHPYKRLFARFVNKTVSGSGDPQEIMAFGGESSFAIERIHSYNID